MQVSNLHFNSAPSAIMHIDLNSCFATIEQQANPKLRGKPIAVAAYPTPSGCILAPSIEAKSLGIKTGMKVKDGRLLCPQLTVLSSDPDKYRSVHVALRKILSTYTNDFSAKSIDEFVLNLEGYPAFKKGMHKIAKQIKHEIKKNIGEWLTVSVGIAPNRFLAKTASGLRKPDGLDEINKDNFSQVYVRLKLTDLTGIAAKNAARLSSVGINSVTGFYEAPLWRIKAAFASVTGYYWYLRLRGWQIDDVEFARKSFGNSYALPKPTKEPEELAPILTKLVEKTGYRLRKAGYKARGVHLALSYRDRSFWHKGASFPKDLFSSRDIYKKAYRMLLACPYRKPVREISVSCFKLTNVKKIQLDLFEDVGKSASLERARDLINERWGKFVITPARMYEAKDAVPDRIAFGAVKELEEIITA